VGCSQPGEAERLSLVDLVPIDRKRWSEPDTAVVPRRLRIPLTLGEVDPMRRGQQRSRELKARSSLDFLGERTTDVVGDVDLAALEHRQPRALVGDAAEHEAPARWRLAPT